MSVPATSGGALGFVSLRPGVEENLTETFDFAAEYYDTLFGERPDLPFYLDEARSSGGPVLELGCGTGRILLPIARAGIEITGLDISQSMLGILRRKLAAEPPEVQQRVRLVEGNMRDFQPGQTYRLAMIPFRTFEQLTAVEDEKACLAAIRRHLDSSGRLVLDLFDPSLPGLIRAAVRQGLSRAGCSASARPVEEPDILFPDGRRLHRSWQRTGIDLLAQVQRMEMCYTVTQPDGRQERGVHQFASRWLYRRQAERLLAACGFEVEHLYADYDRSEFRARRTGDLIIVARRV